MQIGWLLSVIRCMRWMAKWLLIQSVQIESINRKWRTFLRIKFLMFVYRRDLIGCPTKCEGVTDCSDNLPKKTDKLCPSLWPGGIDSRLGRNRLWVRFLAMSDIYPMFIEPTITWVPSGFSGYICYMRKKKNIWAVGTNRPHKDPYGKHETFKIV